MKSTRIMLLIISMIVLSSCAWEPRMGPQNIYIDVPVDKSDPILYYNKRIVLFNFPKVLFYPFVVTQRMQDSEQVGKEISKIIARVWMTKRVFPEIMIDDKVPMLGASQWTCLGRCKEANLVVSGEVTHLIDGGTTGNSSVSIRLTVYATGTGEPILTMEHAGRIEAGFLRDYYIMTARNRLPQDPIYYIINSLAADLADKIKDWGDTYPMKIYPPTTDGTKKSIGN